MLLLLALASGCSEKPQLIPQGPHDDWAHQLRDRSLRQSEAQRSYP
jgi:hypothetical protein